MRHKLHALCYTACTLFLASAQPAYAITNPVIDFGSGDYGEALATIIANLWKAAVIAGAIAFILYFLWGAFRWMTAESDKAKLESGREKITNALVGLILLVASVAIIQLLGTLLNIKFLKNLKFTFPGT
jgi:ABC-type Mn2+/Zn2+ transport system permease subunit